MTTSQLIKDQKKVYGPKFYTENGTRYRVTATVRYDDQCGNGHNSFAITGNQERHERGRWEEDSCGCLHEIIAKQFPELAPYIKWHGMNSDGPTHYVENTVYHAGDRDCWGLRKGEGRQIRNGKTGEPAWELVAVDANGEMVPTYKLPEYADGENPPECQYRLEWRPWMRWGDGKERDLQAARSTAIWPDATDEELTAPGLEDRLKARLPKLIEEFQQALKELGLTY